MAGQQSLIIVTKFVTYEKLYFSGHNDHRYLDVTTTLNNFDSFVVKLFNRQVKQPKSTKGTLHR